MSQSPFQQPWSFSKRLAFRFFFLFFVLYIFFNPNGVFPGIDALYGVYITPFHSLIPWIGKHVLHLSYNIDTFTNGSGDTTYDFVVLLFTLLTALAGSLIWTALDRNRKSYNQLYYWLTVVVRYYAAFTMLTYGFVKIFKLQFPAPSLNRLLQPYGESSPMGLAWTFMGYSEGYNLFTGAAEALGGILLLFRRTALLGAIVTLIVMANVMAMNYCFDIPVKLLSTIMVVMACFLLAKDMHRLINVFFLNKTAEPGHTKAPRSSRKWVRITLLAGKILLVGYTLVMTVYGSYSALSQYGDKAAKPVLYGIYDVDMFVKNGDTLPPLKTDSVRWSRMVINYDGYAGVKLINDSATGYAFEPDTAKKQIVLYSYKDTLHKALFAYSNPEKNILLLQGKWKDDSFHIRMKQYDLKKFLLVNRGFRWVNEYPYNR